MEEHKKNKIPWELISQAIENNLTGDEEMQLRQWLEADSSHLQIFSRLKEVWENDMSDYSFYQKADASAAWTSLQERLIVANIPANGKLIKTRFGKTKMFKVWASVAALFLIALITVFYISSHTPTLIYATAADEKKNIMLPDGSKVILDPLTRLEVSPDFNQKDRTVILRSGKVFFDIQHLAMPFIVSMETSFVKDIGTSFTIEKNGDSIRVDVIEGIIVFGKINGNETRELTKGMSIGFNRQKNSFGTITKKTDSSLLEFDNTALADVIIRIEEAYNRKIVLTSDGISNRRLTANLNGLSFDEALQIVTTSLHLEYKFENGVFEIKEKK